ncbi:response regulator of citrate/malate metabolism [Kitasatospora sp. SolWspMP-SS2h]|uniref:response regulator n=1 Tax=Kitasatospora sp. SolWspMP-SS2h TaxID=1305729 RepID=UPI000DBA2466|nr:response regulator [Kitasatospora sp. SolWspMP-SS2h]RAJ36796.1 response regulator of citrate/malate metabolism [Kitasatospora sp. SolWspMP-SS2h]
MIDVLVVDDDFRVADVHAAYVAKVPGFRVTGIAHSAGQALAALERAPVDLVLLDHHLPDESGLALIRRLREAGICCDVMMVTAARDVSTVHEAMQHGALQYLVKPFSFAGLRDKLAAYADLRHALAGPSARETSQDEVDRMFAALRTGASPATALPKGHSAPTADLVLAALRRAGQPLSAQQVAAATGLSRSTAQRYLKHLARDRRLRLSLRYGDTGRPEHEYLLTVR